MWKYACALLNTLVFPLICFSMDIGLGSKIRKPLSRQQIYIDVLQNITHVNNILNDLLMNYKHLKTIYEAKAKSENELSGEIDVKDENDENNTGTIYDNFQEGQYRPVTQMILSEESFPEESNDKFIENIDIKGQLQPQFPDTQISFNNEIKSDDNDVDNSKEIVDLTRTQPLQHELSNKESPVKISSKPDLIIIGTAIEYAKQMPKLDNEEYKNTEKVLSNVNVLNKPILRAAYNNVDKLRNSDYIQRGIKQPEQDKTTEVFSYYQGLRKKKTKNGNNFNSKDILLFIGNKEQIKPLFRTTTYGYTSKDEEDSGEEEMLRREQLKSQILRDAYGSACLQVAIRKCYKALTQVRKLICTMDFKCKDSFKDHFKSQSKVGCLKEFDYKRNNNDKPNKTSNSINARVKKNDGKKHEKTRSGSNINYHELCLPVMMSEETNNDKSTVEKKQPRELSKIKPINVLRDYYENKCKQMSREKCERACNFAVSNTCDQHSCQRDERKSFSRTCRQECKYSFGGDDSDSDDSDSDYDDDDDDDDDEDDSFSFE